MTTKAAASREPIFPAGGSHVASLAASRVVSNHAGTGTRRVPLFIPAEQAYYWSSMWQQGEAETRANLKVGNAQTFSDPLDAVRHLLSDDC